MQYIFPHTIQNCVGEKIVFERIETTPQGNRVVASAVCQPGCGPVMHTHFKQDEGMTITAGKMGYQVPGEQPKFANPGETVVFKRGVPHKFWAEGDVPLHCTAWLQPVNTAVFFLTSLYAAQNRSGSGRPEPFDAAHLTVRYSSEYNIVGMPIFVRKVIVPITYYVGKLFGKYRHFKNAPEPIR